MDRADKLKLIGDDSVRKLDLTKGEDTMTVSVTEDARYRADIVGSVSSANHGNADSFLKEIARFLGGVLNISRQGHSHHHQGHGHSHGHGHTHSH